MVDFYTQDILALLLMVWFLLGGHTNPHGTCMWGLGSRAARWQGWVLSAPVMLEHVGRVPHQASDSVMLVPMLGC